MDKGMKIDWLQREGQAIGSGKVKAGGQLLYDDGTIVMEPKVSGCNEEMDDDEREIENTIEEEMRRKIEEEDNDTKEANKQKIVNTADVPCKQIPCMHPGSVLNSG
jgi:hypothetical protein